MTQVYVIVDCEGINVLEHTMREFGAVELSSLKSFYGKDASRATFYHFEKWLEQFKGRKVFVSDNPAYDWQGINYGFLHQLGRNPFGHSARRVGDFYAGLKGNWRNTSGWKNLRKTPHTHNPVDDARGNAEALREILGVNKGAGQLPALNAGDAMQEFLFPRTDNEGGFEK